MARLISRDLLEPAAEALGGEVVSELDVAIGFSLALLYRHLSRSRSLWPRSYREFRYTCFPTFRALVQFGAGSQRDPRQVPAFPRICLVRGSSLIMAWCLCDHELMILLGEAEVRLRYAR